MKQFLLFILLGISTSLLAENWPRFRGPNGAGISNDEIPVTWKSDNFKWKTKLPGVGHGSPVVWEGRIYLLCANEDTGQRTAVGLNAKTGRILWQQAFKGEKHKHHKNNSFASSTPAVDGDGVYYSWGTPRHSHCWR